MKLFSSGFVHWGLGGCKLSFVRVSGWLAMVCRVVRGGSRWWWLDFGRSGGGGWWVTGLFILNQ